MKKCLILITSVLLLYLASCNLVQDFESEEAVLPGEESFNSWFVDPVENDSARISFADNHEVSARKIFLNEETGKELVLVLYGSEIAV